jgi:hypothetical protein
MPAGVTNYPASLDSTTNLPDTTGKNQDDGSGDNNAIHSNLHDTTSTAVIAVETKVGSGSSVPTTTGHVLTVTGSGASAWQAAGAGTPSSTVVTLDQTSSSTAGTASEYSRGDHKHRLPGQVREATFGFPGTVTSPTTGRYKYRVKQAATLLSIRVQLGTAAAAGAALTVDLLKNGSSVLSTTPSVTVGQDQNTNTPVFTSTALAADDRLSVSTLTGTDGADLVVTVEFQDTTPA